MASRKWLLSVLTLIALLLPNLLLAADFSDVGEDHKAKVAIDYLKDEVKCINGYEDGTFRPNKEISRVETLSIVLKCLDLDAISQQGEFTLNSGDFIMIGDERHSISGDATKIRYEKTLKFPDPAEDELLDFSDIDKKAWYINPLQEAVHRDLIKGYADKTIRPHQQVALNELLTILLRVARTKDPNFSPDLSVLPDYIKETDWDAAGLAMGIDKKLIGLEEGKRLDRTYTMNRAEAVIIIYNWLVLSQKDKTASVETVSTTATADVTDQFQAASTGDNNSSSFAGFTESGVASYYSYGVDGIKTASGEALDVHAYQAAHKTLPFGTIVKVTNPSTGKWVKARVVDRGPYVEGRILDLTPSAFEAIADLSAGLVKVDLAVESTP